MSIEGTVEPCLEKLALAWVDRWRALGGDFTAVARKGEDAEVRLGMLVDLDIWRPADRCRDDLPPYVRLTDREHHVGAVRALNGLLELCPELANAVRQVGRGTIPAITIAE